MLSTRRLAVAAALLAGIALAVLPPLQGLEAFTFRRAVLAAALGILAVAAISRAPRLSPLVAIIAFFAVPSLGGIVNYPHLHTPELAQLSEWARSTTPRDAVFLFPDAGHSVDPGIFRSEALRAVYVDWKGGGQINYVKGFTEEWWFRWQQTVAARFHPADLPKYGGLGISYIVLRPGHRLPRPAAFENAKYVAYAVR